MDCFTRYGLEFNPFIKNSKDILVDTSEYKYSLLNVYSYKQSYVVKYVRLLTTFFMT